MASSSSEYNHQVLNWTANFKIVVPKNRVHQHDSNDTHISFLTRIRKFHINSLQTEKELNKKRAPDEDSSWLILFLFGGWEAFSLRNPDPLEEVEGLWCWLPPPPPPPLRLWVFCVWPPSLCHEKKKRFWYVSSRRYNKVEPVSGS